MEEKGCWQPEESVSEQPKHRRPGLLFAIDNRQHAHEAPNCQKQLGCKPVLRFRPLLLPLLLLLPLCLLHCCFCRCRRPAALDVLALLLLSLTPHPTMKWIRV
eukprot:TRINITY_DN38098_c0_g1_i1.p1 TRINITY_DN38098_c0_g1~~TRINITY_DN38098_c0_g1_i1.p1  ORF type:complete len:103 (+),score=11.60 TRINITY_DN38098_c0_g1_i1:201-509(+)